MNDLNKLKSFDKMKSKEGQRRILQKNGIEQISNEDNFFKAIVKSMDEFAKQKAIAFINWTLQSECEYSCTDEDQWTHQDILENGIVQNITTEQLYNLYLESKKQKV